MLIAQQLQNTNRAEYLLYMWQVEDIIRAYGCDADRIAAEYLERFNVDEETKGKMYQWYADLCEMMRSEQKTQRGHLQICKNIVIGLDDLHQQLLASEKFPYYKQMYYKVLPYVVELRARNGESQRNGGQQSGEAPQHAADVNEAGNELTSLFEVLYGVMLLRLQKRPVSEGTAESVKHITAFLGQLSDYWKAYKAGDLTDLD